MDGPTLAHRTDYHHHQPGGAQPRPPHLGRDPSNGPCIAAVLAFLYLTFRMRQICPAVLISYSKYIDLSLPLDFVDLK